MYTIKKNEAADVGILNNIYLRLVKDGNRLTVFKKDDQHINECWLTGIFLSFVHTAINMQLPLSINEQA